MALPYDVVVIGTGAGGGTLIRRLAPTGKKILVLERGSFLPREKANWDAREVWGRGRYHSPETWYGPNGESLRAEQHYFVGGNTKLYGAALFRFRERDFERVQHEGGISPEWPVKYRDFAPYYEQAEKLYDVHGNRGVDPTEPPAATEYPFPAVSPEPQMGEIRTALEKESLHPFELPLGVKVADGQNQHQRCILCDTCDGFPCLLDSKADADVNGIRPALLGRNVTLQTGAKVVRLHTSASGREVTGVEVETPEGRETFAADLVVVACGAINSALLLLRSANDRHPDGLANRSGLVGRNYMAHNAGAVLAFSAERNRMSFQKTLAVTDFYWGDKAFDFPLGSVQAVGRLKAEKMARHGPPAPGFVFRAVERHSMAWFLISEDLPDPVNRVVAQGDRVTLHYRRNNLISYRELKGRWIGVLKAVHRRGRVMPMFYSFHADVGLEVAHHQCGTCRFGEDPASSVLDVHCRTHDIDNLYVVDSSFFPSSAALNPALTIMANALRVGDHLVERMK